MEICSFLALILTLLYHCHECLGEDLASCNNNDSDGSGCNGERSDRSSGEKLWTALGVSGGSAALGLVSVLALIAVVLVCKRKCRQRRSFSPESGSREAPVRRVTTRKKSLKASQNGNSEKLTHNYETVLPNFSAKPQAKKTAQNYEVPLSKSATLPRDFPQESTTDTGQTLNVVQERFSQSAKVRGSSPEPVYMNTKNGSGDVSVTNPWTHHKMAGYHLREGNVRVLEQVNESETRLVSPGDPWAT